MDSLMPASDEGEIVRVLCDQHRCHTVILYGSRARNAAMAGSDWDVLGVRTDGESVRDVRQLKDGWLDAFVHPESHFATLDEGSLRFVNGKVLVDREGFASKLLARVAAFEAAGPKQIRAEDEATLRAWYPKMLDRIMRDDTEARYRRAWLLYDALEAYFRLRNRWYRGPKQSLSYLQEHDPATYHAFERALAPDASLDDLSDLVRAVLSS
jgi:predicted nucleotidyltransferase